MCPAAGILRNSGYEVATAESGLDGLREFRAHPADLLILDIFMPVMDGIEMVQELRREFPQVKSIAISGKRSEKPMLAVARGLGIVSMLEKPFSREQLLSAVEQALKAESGLN